MKFYVLILSLFLVYRCDSPNPPEDVRNVSFSCDYLSLLSIPCELQHDELSYSIISTWYLDTNFALTIKELNTQFFFQLYYTLPTNAQFLSTNLSDSSHFFKMQYTSGWLTKGAFDSLSNEISRYHRIFKERGSDPDLPFPICTVISENGRYEKSISKIGGEFMKDRIIKGYVWKLSKLNDCSGCYDSPFDRMVDSLLHDGYEELRRMEGR